MDVQPVVDAIVQVVQSNPKTAAFLALVPLVQMAAGVGAKLTQRTHSTWLNRALTFVAALPIRVR